MSKNQFFIVGAQRSGTTYLYTILDEHPEVCMAKPIKPEPKYFLNSRFDETQYYNTYYSHSSSSTKIFGEKSTSYYENEIVAQKISKNMPLAKIIFILANPVDRAISNYNFSFENGLETRNIEDVFINNVSTDTLEYSTSVNPFNYKQRGIYYKYIENYYNYFPKENIKIIVREEFTNNINAIQDLYKFLNIDSTFIPNSIDRIVNSSKNKLDLSSSVLESLAEYYKEPNERLQKLLGKDFRLWQ